MYTPSHFVETDASEIARVMHDFPLAVLVSAAVGSLDANHLPLLRAPGEEGPLIGHVALANPMHRDIDDGARVLAIFRAGDAYVSPNWYPSKAETHKAVPTWNYLVVHVHGTIRWSHAPKDKRRAVALLTARHEAAVNGEGAWRMGDAPADFLEDLLGKIVAFHIDIDRIEAKSKLNQNRSAADIAGVGDALCERGNLVVGHAMRRTPKG